MTIEFENESGYCFPFEPEKELERLISLTVRDLECPLEVEVGVTVVTPKQIRDMNREFRKVDSPTDVLSFPMMEYDVPADFSGTRFQETEAISRDTGELLLGDIVLCAEILERQAREYGHSLLREFAFLTAHGMLHLFGYDHMEEEEREIMERKQREIMQKAGIAR